MDMSGFDETAANPEAANTMMSSSIVLASPSSGQSWSYDETSGAAPFRWEGQAQSIMFSRNASMRPVTLKANVNGSSYEFYNAYPGTWYWQVMGADGASEVRSFTVNPAVKRNVSLSEPTSGATLAGNGGKVSWSTDSKVAFYRVELTTTSFGQSEYRFASSGSKSCAIKRKSW